MLTWLNPNLKPFFNHLLGNHRRVQLPTLVGAERKQQKSHFRLQRETVSGWDSRRHSSRQILESDAIDAFPDDIRKIKKDRGHIHQDRLFAPPKPVPCNQKNE